MVIPIGIVIPAQDRQRQVDPWDFLASVPSKRPYLKKQYRQYLMNDSCDDPLTSTHSYIHTCVAMCCGIFVYTVKICFAKVPSNIKKKFNSNKELNFQ